MPLRRHPYKGKKPRNPNPNLCEQPIDRRVAFVRSDGVTSARQEAAYWKDAPNPPTHSCIVRIRQKAREIHAKEGLRNGKGRKPLADITHVLNKPRPGAPRKLTLSQRAELVKKAVSSREERKKSAIQHCNDYFNETQIRISPEYFSQMMYDAGYHRGHAEYKPNLTDKHKKQRKERAQQLLWLLENQPETLCFTDAAAIRLQEDEEHTYWMRVDEGYHEDVKEGTERKNGYSCGQFFGIIALGVQNGPYHIFLEETDSEKILAEKHLKELNLDMDRFYGATHDWAEVWEKMEEERTGRKRKGRKPQKETWQKVGRFARGNRDAGGVDWYRFCYSYLVPKVQPWYKELSFHRAHFEIALDNASPHTSKHTLKILDMARIVRFIWPAQSPDMNPIEQIWKYIRRQIRNRRNNGTYPSTILQMHKAWEEEWEKIPQEVIDNCILKIKDICRKVIENDGNNNFHG